MRLDPNSLLRGQLGRIEFSYDPSIHNDITPVQGAKDYMYFGAFSPGIQTHYLKIGGEEKKIPSSNAKP
jgi:hypothetical protein